MSITRGAINDTDGDFLKRRVGHCGSCLLRMENGVLHDGEGSCPQRTRQANRAATKNWLWHRCWPVTRGLDPKDPCPDWLGAVMFESMAGVLASSLDQALGDEP